MALSKRCRTLYGDTPLRSAFEEHVRPDDTSDGRGTGYVVDTLRTVRRVVQEPSYERVVRQAIGHGRDTDTTASIAGGLAGVRHGIGGIPPRWIAALRGRELVEPLTRIIHTRSV